MNDSPQLFDPDAFAAPPDPVEVHDLEIDPDAAELEDAEDAEASAPEPLLEEPLPAPDAELDEPDVEPEPVSQSVLDLSLIHI